MAIGCFISVGRSLDDAIARVRLAEELGYDAAYVTHIAGRDSLTVLAGYAAATSRIGLGTGVVPIYTRTPATMAQTAATLARALRRAPAPRASASRTAPSSRAGTGRRSTSPWPRCASTSRSCARSCAARPPPAGREVADELPRSSGIGPLPRPADLRRRAVAGDAAPGRRDRRRRDAVAVQPEYIRDVVVPEVTRRARARRQDARGLRHRGRRPGGASSTTRPPRYASMRRDLIPYFGLPFYRAMLERSGFGDGHRRLRRGRRARRRRGDAGGDLRALPARAVPRRLADDGARRRRALPRRRAPPRRAWARSRRPTSRRRCGRGRRAEVEPHALRRRARLQPHRGEGATGGRGARRRPRARGSWDAKRVMRNTSQMGREGVVDLCEACVRQERPPPPAAAGRVAKPRANC